MRSRVRGRNVRVGGQTGVEIRDAHFEEGLDCEAGADVVYRAFEAVTSALVSSQASLESMMACSREEDRLTNSSSQFKPLLLLKLSLNCFERRGDRGRV